MLSPDSLIKSIGDQPLPPVESWDPQFCGKIDLSIKSDGRWLYNGSEITRQKMKHLFSRVIKKQDNHYFLVTPVEKVAIDVEWQPFVIVDYSIIQKDNLSVYQLVDNFDNLILLTEPCQLSFSYFQSQKLPIINVRRNLYASFSRNCYYRLLNEAQSVERNDQHQVFIQSNGLSFLLGEYQENQEDQIEK